MNPEPLTREWLRVVRHFKAQQRVRNRAPKRHTTPSESPEIGVQKNAKEL